VMSPSSAHPVAAFSIKLVVPGVSSVKEVGQTSTERLERFSEIDVAVDSASGICPGLTCAFPSSREGRGGSQVGKTNFTAGSCCDFDGELGEPSRIAFFWRNGWSSFPALRSASHFLPVTKLQAKKKKKKEV